MLKTSHTHNGNAITGRFSNDTRLELDVLLPDWLDPMATGRKFPNTMLPANLPAAARFGAVRYYFSILFWPTRVSGGAE